MEATILVIEEDLDLSKLFYYMLRTQGYTVKVTHDWQMAQEIFDQAEPDLIIFDWGHTNTDGYVWVDELLASPKTERVPVLCVCGDPPSHGISKMLDKAGVQVIEKPFDILEFRQYVAGLLMPQERMAGVA